ncbi:MAG: DUF2059 domain-containing protein [Pseudomonadota bacterium]|nr:DUF2059 domain-containing protein [Pseudomonadota bacterium]
MKRMILAAACAVATMTSAGFAQDREMELARQILGETGEIDIAMSAIEDMMPLIEGNIRGIYPDLSTRQYAEIMQVYREEFAAARGDFETVFVETYAAEFTEDELEDLLAFYRSDLGRRLTSALPEITEAAGNAGEMVGLRVDQRAAPRVRDILLGNTNEPK